MREQMAEVCDLQPHYTSFSSAEMNTRGVLIRRDIPQRITPLLSRIQQKMGRVGADLEVEGSDNQGRYSEVPWVRVYSASRSPNATNGWYVVYLFAGDGSGLYLSLIHGSTKWAGGSFVPRPNSELDAQVEWARTSLATATAPDVARLSTQIDLRWKVSKVAKAYERGTALAIWYDRNLLPADYQLERDLLTFCQYLAVLYKHVDLERVPDEAELLLQRHHEAIRPSQSASPRQRNKAVTRSSGQGRGLTGAEIRAVDAHAMSLAHAKLVELGCMDIHDTSKTSSYDFVATFDGEEIIVEVKGTTGYGLSLLFTSNEIEMHLAKHPRNMLIIVHTIDLARDNEPVTSGGVVEIIYPWAVEEEKLRPQTYSYSLRTSGPNAKPSA